MHVPADRTGPNRPDPTEPERTCAGCRLQDARGALLRFAVHPGERAASVLVPDVRHRLPGRGVSVHPSRACLERAVHKGGFAKALKGRVDVDVDALAGLAIAQYRSRLEGLLSSALRSRRAAVGTDAVRDALADGSLVLLLVAEDAAGRRDELCAWAERVGRRAAVVGDKEWLGRLAGRSELGVLGILDGGIADEIATIVVNVTELGASSEPRVSEAREE